MIRLLSIIISIILFGGVFFTSEQFMNIENDIKFYYIILMSLLLITICSIRSKGFSELLASFRSYGLYYGFIVVSLLLSVYGLSQFFGCIQSRHYSFPITGTFENPAGFAAVQAMLFPFALLLSFEKVEKRILRVLSHFALLLVFLSVALSGSRAGILAMFTAIIVYILLNTKAISLIRRHQWLLVFIIVIAAIGLYALYRIKSDSVNGRILIWRVCLDMIHDKPLFGFGMDGFQQYYMSYQASYNIAHPDSNLILLADNIVHPFNEYLKLTICFGITGLLVIIIALMLLLRLFFKSNRVVKTLGLTTVASSFVLSQFSYPYFYSVVWLISIIVFVSVFPLSHNENRIHEVSKKIRFPFLIVSSILLLIISRSMYLDMKWAEIAKRSLSGQTEKMLPYYSKMKPQMKHNPLFLYNYAAELNYVENYDESLAITKECLESLNDYDVQLLLADNLSNISRIDESINAYQQAANMIPCRFEPLDGIMNLYLSKGDTLCAVKVAHEIVEKSVKIPSLRVNQIIESAQLLIESKRKYLENK